LDISAGGTQRLSRLVGISTSKLLIFTAKILDHKEALNIGYSLVLF